MTETLNNATNKLQGADEKLQAKGRGHKPSIPHHAPLTQTSRHHVSGESGTGAPVNSALILESGDSRLDMDALRRELHENLWDMDSDKFGKLDNPADEAFAPRITQGAEFSSVARRISHAFRFDGFTAREIAVSPSISDTYSWIYHRDPITGNATPPWSSFPSWLERPSDPVYWITGKPGAGKSTIMKYILGNAALRPHLEAWSGDLPLVIASYYAWNAGTSTQKSLLGLKRTLIFQVLDQNPQLLPIVAPRRWTSFWLLGTNDRIHMRAVTGQEIEECFSNLLRVVDTKVSVAVFIDGLDELEVPPNEIVNLVESIASFSQNNIKVCAASRPWVEFEDAYCDVPKLRMDLYTAKDMGVFVAERFGKCRAFSELSAIHPAKSLKLQNDLAQKANGVFIWLRLVVDALESAATDGSGISELSDIVEGLPADMCSLYDALWARIPTRNWQRGAVFIQVVETAEFDIDPTFLWLVDEYASRKHDISADQLLAVEGTHLEDRHAFVQRIQVSLKRKLASRTRGILVITGNVVSFTHRTASEWATQPDVWRRLAEECGGSDFDPNLLIVEMLTVKTASRSLFNVTALNEPDFFDDIVEPTLRCASRVSDTGSRENIDALVRALDTFDKRAKAALEQITSSRHPSRGIANMAHWSSIYYGGGGAINLKAGNDNRKQSTFIGYTAQFAVLPYIKVKAATNKRILFQRGTRKAIGILESAIFGYRFYAAEKPGNEALDPKIHTKERLQMVRFLLEMGVEQTKMTRGKQMPKEFENHWERKLKYKLAQQSLRGYVGELAATEGSSRSYYAEIVKMLGGNSPNVACRSAVMWLKSQPVGRAG